MNSKRSGICVAISILFGYFGQQAGQKSIREISIVLVFFVIYDSISSMDHQGNVHFARLVQSNTYYKGAVQLIFKIIKITQVANGFLKRSF